MSQTLLWSFLFLQIILLTNAARWEILLQNIGITAMHMQLLHNDRVIIFDRTDFGMSNLSLPNGKCRKDSSELVIKYDCTAHSAEYDVLTNKIRPLMVQTDIWCSSGSVMSDGRLVQTGGFNDGERRVRIFSPCSGNECDWQEVEDGLKARRWYATNHILPDGNVQIIIGGRRQFNYEYYPKTAASEVYSMPFLAQTHDPGEENNLYPFVFLAPDGNLFIFSNNRAILFDYANKQVVKTYPSIPGGDPRCYPSTGSAVLLPLKNVQAQNVEAEVLVCGGAPKGSFGESVKGNFKRALDTCGRIKITDQNPQWVIETMPQARVMGDMTILPNGHVLIINGGGSGTAGWELGRDPVFSPVLYRPDGPVGSRFESQKPSEIPRMYHSTAILLSDGKVLVGGSNPHIYYNFTGVLYPTELRLEAFYPSYLDARLKNLRPALLTPASKSKFGYAQSLTVRFRVTGKLVQNMLSVTMVAPSLTTHSFSMNQRLLNLGNKKVTNVRTSTYDIRVKMPPSPKLAPPGYYMLFVVHQSIPSEGVWVHIS